MSVAPYSFIPEEPPRYKKYRSRRKSSLRYTRDRQNTNHLSSVEGLASSPEQTLDFRKRRSRQISPTISPQLRFMLQLQKASSVITFCLVALTLGIYAWTVYVPRLWSKEYRDLETLQRHERHLTATNETIKDQLAKQAEQAQAGLTNPKPEQAIFLPQTTVTPIANPSKPKSVPTVPLESTTPVSY